MKKVTAGLVIAGFLAMRPEVGHAALGDQKLKPEMQHAEVEDLQKILKQKGYFTYSGDTTTYYGTYTTDAVKKFQRDHGLTADGETGNSTYKALGVFSKPAMVETAKKYEGTPYEWGGEDPDGFDCSGYLNYIFDEAAGIDLPRTVKEMYGTGTSVSSPAVGDIVYYDIDGGGPSHAGVYIGNGKFMHSGSSNGVTTADMDSSYWAPKYEGAKRYR
ncbi:NlpC/P60 family protein [Fictibacillus aquaticus]|uniref:Endopeptidase n=1 Tax=Fictibacillus aquaticus TaxID=2021314 RepID=A0A235F5V2_9BACL|nr:NlpC/P60 family protein [Fictibacillus aquaticus]OYD56619.1 endopeptidase [Fictibacillus aquaticus]